MSKLELTFARAASTTWLLPTCSYLLMETLPPSSSMQTLLLSFLVPLNTRNQLHPTSCEKTISILQ
jgi:hypothetical protein